MEGNVHLIKSEEDAWKILEGALNHTLIVDEEVRIEFQEWPTIQFRVSGRRWKSTIPTRIMPPILEIQKDLYRAYARVHYGDNDIRRLTNEERESLEIVVKVSEGSSEFMALLEAAMNTFVHGAVTKMSATQLIVTVLGIALVVAGRLGWKDWLDARLQAKEIDSRVELSQEETQRMKVMAEATKREPTIKETKDEADITRDSLVRSLDDPDELHVGEVKIDGGTAKGLAKKPRETAEPIRLDGLFRILEVKTRTASFRLHLKRIDDGLEFHADARDAVLNHDMRESLQKGEWERKPVEFTINASSLRGNISQADVISARIPEDGKEG